MNCLLTLENKLSSDQCEVAMIYSKFVMTIHLHRRFTNTNILIHSIAVGSRATTSIIIMGSKYSLYYLLLLLLSFSALGKRNLFYS